MGTRITKPAEAKKKIGTLLIEEDIISRGQLREALKVQKEEGGKIVEILISLGYMDANRVSDFMSKQPGVASIELANYRVSQEIVDLVPREFAVKNGVFPVDKLGKLLTVGMEFPLDGGTIKQLEEMTGLRVKSLLCHHEDIKNAIERYYTKTEEPTDEALSDAQQIETGARLENMQRLIKEVDALPTLPETVEKVREAAASPESSMRDIAQIVAQDPPICAKLLKLANSAAYGFKNCIDSVELAVNLLGLHETCDVVLSSAVIDLTEKSSNFDHEKFWKNSLFCAAAAKHIAAACGERRRQGVFTAGLLANIGRFALAEAAPGRYDTLDPALKSNALKAAEEELFGIGHPEAGHILAEHWGLPPEIGTPIRFHLAPQHAEEHAALVHMVAVAAHLTEIYSHGEEISEDQFGELLTSINFLELSTAQAVEVYRSITE